MPNSEFRIPNFHRTGILPLSLRGGNAAVAISFNAEFFCHLYAIEGEPS